MLAAVIIVRIDYFWFCVLTDLQANSYEADHELGTANTSVCLAFHLTWC